MLGSGLGILAFVVFHLLHYPLQLAPVDGVKGGLDFHSLTTRLADGTQVQDVYAMMVHGFQVGWVSLFYLIAQALLFVHLGHGLSSMFQSLGLRNHVWGSQIAAFAKVVSLVVFLGYASIPVAVLTGMGSDYIKNIKKAPTTNTETLR